MPGYKISRQRKRKGTKFKYYFTNRQGHHKETTHRQERTHIFLSNVSSTDRVASRKTENRLGLWIGMFVDGFTEGFGE